MSREIAEIETRDNRKQFMQAMIKAFNKGSDLKLVKNFERMKDLSKEIHRVTADQVKEGASKIREASYAGASGFGGASNRERLPGGVLVWMGASTEVKQFSL